MSGKCIGFVCGGRVELAFEERIGLACEGCVEPACDVLDWRVMDV